MLIKLKTLASRQYKSVCLFFAHVLARTCDLISKLFSLQSWGNLYSHHPAEDGSHSEWLYFLDFGRPMLIIRKNGSRCLMGSFTVVARYDSINPKKARVISCRPLIMTLKEGDRVFFGRKNANRAMRKINA